MKNPISWHKDCLANAQHHYASLLQQIERLKVEHARGMKALNAYDAQIIRAEEMGIAEFDREKFGKPKPSSAASNVDRESK